MVPRVGVEPTNLAVVDFESTASANSATWALLRTAKLENASARVHVKFCASVLNVRSRPASFSALVTRSF